MRKHFVVIIIISFAFLSGCSWMYRSTTRRFDDEFRNNQKVIVTIPARPVEKRTEIGSAILQIEREYSSGYDNVTAYFVVERSSSSFGIDNLGYLKANGQTFELSVENAVSEIKSVNETSVSSFAKADSAAVYLEQTSDTDTHIWIDDKFWTWITPQMVDQIKQADDLVFRFYFGPIPATYRIRGSALYELKKALNE